MMEKNRRNWIVPGFIDVCYGIFDVFWDFMLYYRKCIYMCS